MSNIIKLLSKKVSNQIAAGEVIQRPASAVKELLENAIDSKASKIDLVIIDAGKTLIQVIDNGIGMSSKDAEICFLRHTTSKINTAKELLSIKTKGFRGEALSSIASISKVELISKLDTDELGTKIIIEGNEIKSKLAVGSSKGTNVKMKNLFFNVPARRNFLKSNAIETKHTITEFQRVALAHPEVHFTMYNNNSSVFNLPASKLRQRIINIFGKRYNNRLVPVEEDTSITSISGFILKPEFAKRTRGEQYLFVNNRFIKSPYLNHAISQAFTELISKDQFPSYFIYLSVPLDSIDINIHPTKTEINFEDIRSVYAILLSGVKRAIGQYSISPSLDFEQEKALQIRPLRKSDEITYPSIKINPNYNPFNSQEEKKEAISNNLGMYKETQASFIKDDDTLLEKQVTRINVSDSKKYFQYQNKIIITQVKSGLLLIDQKRAHRQILYEDLLKTINQNNKSNSQKLLFPVYIELSISDYSLCKDILEKMQQIGIDIDDFGNNTLVVNGLPSEIKESECENIIEEFIENFKMNSDKFDNIDNKLAWSYAKSSCIKSGTQLDNIEMETLIGQLFTCNSSSIDAKGNVIISKIENMAIDKKFKY